MNLSLGTMPESNSVLQLNDKIFISRIIEFDSSPILLDVW